MRHCYKSGHHSVLEFADFTFRIKGVSRALTHQLVRHRMASFAQRSQRYCVEDGFEYVTPASVKKDPQTEALYRETVETIQSAYRRLVEAGVPAEDSRMLLPNACCSEICVKMNLRELIHFSNERLCACAQWEILRACTGDGEGGSGGRARVEGVSGAEMRGARALLLLHRIEVALLRQTPADRGGLP